MLADIDAADVSGRTVVLSGGEVTLHREALDWVDRAKARGAARVVLQTNGRMLAYSLPNIDATKPEDLGRDGVEDAVAEFTINESRKNMVWINYIALIAQAAPMLGLFGTVYGMVNAFGVLSATGAAEPAELAGDIQIALLTTFWGLLTAIPSLVAYFYFKNRLNNLVAEAHHTSEELINASIQTVNQDAYLAKIPEGIAV